MDYLQTFGRIGGPPVDLTLTLHHGSPGVQFEPARRLEVDGWNAQTLQLYSHCGTHMDAPFHFGVSDRTIDQYAPDAFMGMAWVVRLRQVRAKQVITVADLGYIAEKFLPGDSLLLHTDWSSRVGTDAYRNDLPRISEELARWCVERRVKILGVEPPSVADVNDLEEVTRIHRILLGGDVMIVEGLCGLEQLRSEKVLFMALPLKIAAGDGAPARAIAFELD